MSLSIAKLSAGIQGSISGLNKKNSGAPRPKAFLLSILSHALIPLEYAINASNASLDWYCTDVFAIS